MDIIEYFDQVPDAFVLYFLELRIALTPQYVQKAVLLNYPKVVGLLAEIDELQTLRKLLRHMIGKFKKS